jgi:lipopolysaccharide export system protein LptA
MKRRVSAIAVTVLRAGMIALLLCFSSIGGAEESGGAAVSEKVTLTAESLRYDPEAQRIVAEGNVTIRRGTGRITAEHGEGRSDGSLFILAGNVTGAFPEKKLELTCAYLTYRSRDAWLLASGDVAISSGGDRLRAEMVKYRLGDSVAYEARGDVSLLWEGRTFEADSAWREGDEFRARNVRRFEDPKERVSLVAPTVVGRVEEGVLAEVTAEGGILVEVTGRDGKPVRIRGAKGIYSIARGSVVVTGNASAVQAGRTVSAQSLVMNLVTRRIEALGKPQLSFPVGE